MRPVDGYRGTPRHVLLTGAKKSHQEGLIRFELLMRFQNFVINQIHPLKKKKNIGFLFCRLSSRLIRSCTCTFL